MSFCQVSLNNKLNRESYFLDTVESNILEKLTENFFKNENGVLSEPSLINENEGTLDSITREIADVTPVKTKEATEITETTILENKGKVFKTFKS